MVGGLCENEDDIIKHKVTLSNNAFRDAFLLQLQYRKQVLQSKG